MNVFWTLISTESTERTRSRLTRLSSLWSFKVVESGILHSSACKNKQACIQVTCARFAALLHGSKQQEVKVS